MRVVRALLKAGASVDKPGNGNGCTPLTVACEFGHTATVLVLLRAGANINLADHYSRTPLISAAASGELAVVVTLLEASALVNCADDNGCTPLMQAVLGGLIRVRVMHIHIHRVMHRVG